MTVMEKVRPRRSLLDPIPSHPAEKVAGKGRQGGREGGREGGRVVRCMVGE
jgi:hypothetical protein